MALPKITAELHPGTNKRLPSALTKYIFAVANILSAVVFGETIYKLEQQE